MSYCKQIVGVLSTVLTAGVIAPAWADQHNGYGSAERTNSSWIPYTHYGYVGASVGQSDFENGRCAGNVSGCDRRDIGYRLFTGGRFNDIVGVELAYVNLGEVKQAGGDTRAQGANIDFTAGVPLGMASVFAKVGGIYSWTDVSRGDPGRAHGDEEDFNWSVGAGVQMHINDQWAVRGDWDPGQRTQPARRRE